MRSALIHLEGSSSGAQYDADTLQRLDPVDSRPLLARYDLVQAARTLNPWALAARREGGMWRWRELLPVRDEASIVHLGEGSTPLLPARRLGAALGVNELQVKAEGINPTASFKSRGMAAAVSRALELGATSLIVPSAGNAGGALAAYGAAAGLPVTVAMPADTPQVNITEAQVCGAEVILVEGFISDCGRLTKAMAAQTGAFDVSTLKEPYRLEGKKTMGLELAEQYGWGLPDVIVYPTGGGTGLVGMWKAFDELEGMGLIGAARPRMVSVQAAGCAPIVRAFIDGADEASPWEDPATRASGLRVPSAVGDRLILQALRDSEGTAVAVDESEIDRMQALAGRRGVGYVSPETATAFAAVAALADERWLSEHDRVVVFDTGIGHKYPPPELPRPRTVGRDAADDADLIARLTGVPVRHPSSSAVGPEGGLPEGVGATGVAPLRALSADRRQRPVPPPPPGPALARRMGSDEVVAPHPPPPPDVPPPLVDLVAERRARRSGGAAEVPAPVDSPPEPDPSPEPEVQDAPSVPAPGTAIEEDEGQEDEGQAAAPPTPPPDPAAPNEAHEPAADGRILRRLRLRRPLRLPGMGSMGPRVPGQAPGPVVSRTPPRVPGQRGATLDAPQADVPGEAGDPERPEPPLRLPRPPARDVPVDPLPPPPREA